MVWYLSIKEFSGPYQEKYKIPQAPSDLRSGYLDNGLMLLLDAFCYRYLAISQKKVMEVRLLCFKQSFAVETYLVQKISSLAVTTNHQLFTLQC